MGVQNGRAAWCIMLKLVVNLLHLFLGRLMRCCPEPGILLPARPSRPTTGCPLPPSFPQLPPGRGTPPGQPADPGLCAAGEPAVAPGKLRLGCPTMASPAPSSAAAFGLASSIPCMCTAQPSISCREILWCLPSGVPSASFHLLFARMTSTAVLSSEPGCLTFTTRKVPCCIFRSRPIRASKYKGRSVTRPCMCRQEQHRLPQSVHCAACEAAQHSNRTSRAASSSPTG